MKDLQAQSSWFSGVENSFEERIEHYHLVKRLKNTFAAFESFSGIKRH